MQKIIENPVGEEIKQAILPDHHAKEFRLTEHKGGFVLFSFHPLAWTKVCTDQMLSLEENYDEFLKLDCLPLGVSVDPVPCKHAWAEHLKLKKLLLLSDFWPHGKFSKKLRLFDDEKGFSQRANVIVGEKRRILFYKIYPIKEVPDVKELLGVLKELNR